MLAKTAFRIALLLGGACAQPAFAADPPAQTTAIQSPRDVASGQASGIQSPRDVASGQASGWREGGVNDMTLRDAPARSVQANAIQSPRDPASGQAPAALGDTATHEVGHVTANYNPKELQVDKIQSPRDPASGQATARSAAPGAPGQQAKVTFEDVLISSATAQPGTASAIQSPRDPASGQATGKSAPPGAKRQTCVMNKNCQEFEAVVTPRTAQTSGAAAEGGTGKPEPKGYSLGGTNAGSWGVTSDGAANPQAGTGSGTTVRRAPPGRKPRARARRRAN